MSDEKSFLDERVLSVVGVKVDVVGHLSRRPCPKCGDRVCGGDPTITCCGRDSVDARAITPARPYRLEDSPGTVDLAKDKPEAGLWDEAVNQPAQPAQVAPLTQVAQSLTEARSALEPPTAGEEQVKQNLQAFLLERFQGSQPGSPFVTVTVPDPQPLPVDYITFPFNVASPEMQRLCAARTKLDAARDVFEGNSLYTVPAELYDAIKATGSEEMLRLTKEVWSLVDAIGNRTLVRIINEALQILLTPTVLNPESLPDPPIG